MTKLALKVKASGHVLVSVLEGENYVKVLKEVARELRKVDNQTLVQQFRSLLGNLQAMFQDVTIEELNKVDSKEIIKKLIRTDLKLYQGVEMIIQGILVATIKVSVESIAESMISR